MRIMVAKIFLGIRRIENMIAEAPLGWGLIIICAEIIIASRVILEIIFSSGMFDAVLAVPIAMTAPAVFFNVWFFALFMSLITCLSFFSAQPVKKVARVLLCGLPIILLPPIGLILGILDRFTFLVGTWKEILYHAATVTIYYERFGAFFATEIIIFLLGTFCFFVLHVSKIRSVIGTLAAYGVLIFFGTQPVLFEAAARSNFFAFSFDQQYAFFNIFLLSISSGIVFLLAHRGKVKDVFFRFRPHRAEFFLVLCIVMLIGALHSGHFYAFNFAAGLLLFYFLTIHAVTANDIADVGIDRISNPSRLYVSGMLEKKSIHALSGIALAAVGVMLIVFQSRVLFLISLVNIGASTLYSALRFRKNPFSVAIPALGWSSAVFYGFFSQNPSFSSVPLSLFTHFSAFFILFLFFIPLKDIKDIDGDTKEGVRNFITMAGYEKGRIITAISIALSFPAFAIVEGSIPMFVYALFFSILAALFVMKYERWKERPLFLLLLAFLLLALFVL